jgi:hypothetical protein
MTPLFPAQRAAEEFDQVLDGTATRAGSERYAGLLDTVVLLRDQPDVMPRADFVGDLRSRLMAAAETELVAIPSVVRSLDPVRAKRNNRRLGTAAASLVIIGGTAGMAAAASGALPGHALYPVKLGVEQADAALHLSNAGKGKALLGQASTRLEEVLRLQAQGSPDSALVASTVDAFLSDAETGSDRLFAAYEDSGDTRDIEAVRAFTAQQMDTIGALFGTSRSTDALLVDAADALADIDSHARTLCAECGPATALLPPDALSAGAGAATVDNLLARPVSQVKADIAGAEAARLARIARLQEAAEKSAGQVPTPAELARIADAAQQPQGSIKGDAPVVNTITRDGKLVPSTVNTGAAVDDLVSGVTGTARDVTDKVIQSKGKSPLDPTVEDLTGMVGGALDPTLNGLLP